VHEGRESLSDATQAAFDALATATRLVAARRAQRALSDYPGALPATLDDAYACQDAAIAQWRDTIAGWKVGLIGAELARHHGEGRLIGPIFASAVRRATSGSEVAFPIIGGGFAAVEAEYVFRLGDAIAPTRMQWSLPDASATVAALHVGIETAGSPLATINALGPAVVVSDFGNNNGLIVGREIVDWRERSPSALTCETFVDGLSVGHGGAASLPGGPLTALAFALGRLARRGITIPAGTYISTGATTGIHDIVAGQHARVDFHAFGEIRCRAQAAVPVQAVAP
jgi:2-keto-4-pentenoate hydratase